MRRTRASSSLTRRDSAVANKHTVRFVKDAASQQRCSPGQTPQTCQAEKRAASDKRQHDSRGGHSLSLELVDRSERLHQLAVQGVTNFRKRRGVSFGQVAEEQAVIHEAAAYERKP
jgi:Tfp pilus assembly protein FimT